MRSIEQRGCARRHRTARRPERRGIEGVGASSSRVRVELALPLSHLSPSSSTSSWLMRARGREARCGCASTRGSQKRRVRRLTRSTRSQHGGVRAHERRQWTRRSTRSSSMAWPSCPPLPDRSPRPDAIRWPARSTSGTRSSERARGERAQPSAREDSNPQWQGQNLLCCQLHHPRRAELSLPGVCLGPVLEGHAESMDAS